MLAQWLMVKLPTEFVERLAQMGRWLEKNGITIYNTRKGPFEPRPWGVSTRRGNTIFVHILMDIEQDSLWIPFNEKINQITYFTTGKPVEFTPINNGILLKSLSPDVTNEYDTIIQIDV